MTVPLVLLLLIFGWIFLEVGLLLVAGLVALHMLLPRTFATLWAILLLLIWAALEAVKS